MLQLREEHTIYRSVDDVYASLGMNVFLHVTQETFKTSAAGLTLSIGKRSAM
jgi:hypothetical protein